MAGHTIQASPEGIQTLRKTLKRKKLPQTYLAGAAGCSRQTIWSLLKGNPIDGEFFIEICSQLDLKWEEIAQPELAEEVEEIGNNLDALAREVREKIKARIIEQCGTMRVLDMTQSIGLNDIYTSVNILEKITGRRGIEIDKLMQGFDPEQENFDRVGFGRISEKQVPGLEAVKRYPKLVVLGKPGAGKTTFLKYLAIQCIGGEFLGDRVPAFITLKDFAETDSQPELIEFITQRFAESEVAETQTVELLKQGMVFLLLDGLDEVREEDASRVIKQIEKFSERYSMNHVAITCRIAAREHTFIPFKEVEVADFNNEQINIFVSKWFQVKQLSLVAQFMKELAEHEPIKELATNPLLLILLCLEFEDSGNFPKDRAELYKRATHTLLRKWDTKRGIKRDQVYRNLSCNRKEELLIQLALITFERKEYFFKQRDAERYITDYIRNLPDAKTDPEALQLDSEAVLKSIEAQHGLLVERARGIYSFSHLTFQEYFAARKIVTSCNPGSLDDKALRSLASRITEKRWREVFLLTVKMLLSAEHLLLLMKQQIDALLANDKELQQFLMWVNQKALSVKVPYKLEVVRAVYIVSNIFTLYKNDLFREIFHKTFNLKFPFNVKELGLNDFEISFYPNSELTFVTLPQCSYVLAIQFDFAIIDYGKFYIIFDEFESEMKATIQTLIDSINSPNVEWEPDDSGSDEDEPIQEYIDWLLKYGKYWTKAAKDLMLKYLNKGQNYYFTEGQKELLKQYYDANLLLVECLNSDRRFVSSEVRQEIEDSLFLPIAEIEKRKNRR